jgi:hypothetical protein
MDVALSFFLGGFPHSRVSMFPFVRTLNAKNQSLLWPSLRLSATGKGAEKD